MDHNELKGRFFYKKPTVEEVGIHAALSAHFSSLALFCNEVLPEGREKSLVITKLEEGKFFASAAIARQNRE
jgi:hypothetical protein